MNKVIALARRHVEQCADLVHRQEQLVESLRQGGRDTAQAEILLAQCRRTLAERQSQLDSLLREEEEDG